MPQYIAPRPKPLPKALRKPRNPFVAAGLMRQSGRHGGGTKSQRQSAQRALQQELQRFADHSP